MKNLFVYKSFIFFVFLLSKSKILSYINLEYLLSGEKRKLMEKIYKMNERKLEQKKSELYKTDELFKNRNIVENEEAQIKENNVSLIEVKENIFTKFIKRIKSLFNVM